MTQKQGRNSGPWSAKAQTLPDFCIWLSLCSRIHVVLFTPEPSPSCTYQTLVGSGWRGRSKASEVQVRKRQTECSGQPVDGGAFCLQLWARQRETHLEVPLTCGFVYIFLGYLNQNINTEEYLVIAQRFSWARKSPHPLSSTSFAILFWG